MNLTLSSNKLIIKTFYMFQMILFIILLIKRNTRRQFIK